MTDVVESVRAELVETTDKVKAFIASQYQEGTDYAKKASDVLKDTTAHNILDKQKALYDLNVNAFTKGINDVVRFNIDLYQTGIAKVQAKSDFFKTKTK